ncbi:MAG TPA: sugar transferase [Candidatus Marinimicrobia bacterium]|jgi:exopolysaccharide biosynthesis polyprenyl glycosylphosphotransferase|nr:sugar transferase [Candidatus Neomarinimicrobiota bacterium]HIB70330.1 sugar transferase [Candidatus Neomarinimicrobiota bacterium]HIB96420.1 sugar transferase [Candidatus Neomarinimicrobiota bacterium]HIO36312.1 sugar transferase [Candidatus Neomarinimicrobiota bacterium]HIO73811.1 sugar transferase [Candidatus Neomarinimicrobiota bacterium]
MPSINFRRNYKYWVVVAVLLTTDFLSGLFAFSRTVSKTLEAQFFTSNEIWAIFLVTQFVWTGFFYANGRYRADPTISRFREIQSLLRITLTSVVVVILFNEIFPGILAVESARILTYWFYLVACLCIGRMVIRVIQKALMARGYGKKNTIIIGIDSRAHDIAEHLAAESTGHNLIGFVKPGGNDASKPNGPTDLPVLGSLNEIRPIIEDHHVNEVVIALEKPDHSKLLDILTRSNGAPVSLRIIPDMYEVISGLAKTEELYGLPLVNINPEILTIQQRFVKRLTDLAVSLFVIVPLFPVWLIVSLAIKIESRGPVLYRQERVGQNGNVFMINKFRSMVQEAETMTGPIWAKQEDPRITNVGQFLRRFRLDEVPQFINVLIGDMSVVGPRPERPYFVQKLMEEFPYYYRRHRIRTGITGWAQIKHSYDSSLADVRQKLKYDFFYIENTSFSLDLLIMLRTVLVMISGKGH